MKNYSAKDVDSYIATSPKEARIKLKELRELIKKTVPNVEEKISWGIPFYKYHGLLFGFSVFKDHVSFGFSDLLENKVREELVKKGYTTGKKIIQIKFDQKIPIVIKQILKDKAKKNEDNNKQKK